MTKRNNLNCCTFCMVLVFLTVACAVVTHGLLAIGMAVAAFYFTYCTLYYLAKFIGGK